MQECGGCTACCKLLEIVDVNSKANEWCNHCNINVGCLIYKNKPDDCKQFQCAWLQMPQVGIQMRPDICGVLFEKFADDIMLAVTDGRIESIVMGQLKAFASQGISVMLLNHQDKSKTFSLAPGHTRNFVEKQINGSSNLYRRLN